MILRWSRKEIDVKVQNTPAGPHGIPAVDCRLSFDALVPLPVKYLHLLADRFPPAHRETALFPTLRCLLPFTPLKKVTVLVIWTSVQCTL